MHLNIWTGNFLGDHKPPREELRTGRDAEPPARGLRRLSGKATISSGPSGGLVMEGKFAYVREYDVRMMATTTMPTGTSKPKKPLQNQTLSLDCLDDP